MRNDDRPFGSRTPGAPFTNPEERPIPSERPDPADTIAHGRDSHIVHPETESQQPDGPDDPVTPSSDAAPRSRI